MSAPTRQPLRSAGGIDEILASVDEKPSLSRHVGAARRIDELHRRTPELFRNLSVLVVRNFTIEPIEPILKVAAGRAGLHVDLAYSGYDPAAYDQLEELLAANPDAVFVALRLEELAPALTTDFLALEPSAAAELADSALDHVVSVVGTVRAGCRATILTHNFVMPLSPAAGLADSQRVDGQLNLVRRMNVGLAESVAAMDGVHMLDVDHVFARAGLGHCYDKRGDRASDAPLSLAALRVLADAQVRHIKALRGADIKCVVVDCDNTLWGGLVGEDGVAGLSLGETGLGRRYLDLQQSLSNLRRRGVLLAIASKNERADVIEVLSKHPDCVLSESDFVAMRINWDDKAENVASIARELNLGLEHILFIDDNPVECDWVKARLPAVEVIQWPGAHDGGDDLGDLPLFDSLVVTDEDRVRTELYKSESKRREAREAVTSNDDYLRTLEMVATIGLADAAHLPRLAQLTQRTNQFNLTTRRYDLPVLTEILETSDAGMVWLDLRDRFGSYGVVGCGIVRRRDERAFIDTLLLSCRVIGRGAESVIVNRLARIASEMSAAVLIGEYIPSERNAQVADLYPRLGFEGPEITAEGQAWSWSLDKGSPSYPDWFSISEQDMAHDR
jgi:FkbH-like protein